MESMLRKIGFKKSEQRETDNRQKLQKELFKFSQCVEHGFPNKVSAIGYDPQLSLLALGTKTGALRVFGSPGVEFSSHHRDDISIFQIIFYGQCQLLTLCSDNCLHSWEIGIQDGVSYIEEVKSLSLESKVKAVSSTCLTHDRGRLLLGTESGHVFTVDLYTFKLLEHVIYQDNIMQSAPEDFKVNPGAVEAIIQHPVKHDKILVGYNRGLIVLFDMKQSKAEQFYNSSQQLESLSFMHTGEEFLSSHGNGSFVSWTTSQSGVKPKEQASTPYGPFPCKAISKMDWKVTRCGERLQIFSGGMPRASYGDRHTVTVIQGSETAGATANNVKHVVFEFTSKVIDFITMCGADELYNMMSSHSRQDTSSDNPHTLLVLAEEEFVAIDLLTPGWPCYRLPYLSSLHASAITCSAHCDNVPSTLWNKICDVGSQQFKGHSTRDWPIRGGMNLLQEPATHDLLITGHEDGSMRFWDVSTTCISLLYKLTTSCMFSTTSSSVQADTSDLDPDDEWPPFRKVGTYDPYSDDPRLGVQKISLCPISETLVVGGTAGQVIILEFEREERRQDAQQLCVNIIGERDNFVWKGHEPLCTIERGPGEGSGGVMCPAGFQPVCIIQMYPPAACTALAANAEWQIVASGTAHGFAIVDYMQRRVLYTHCTLSATDLTSATDSVMARRKSFKKSLRESFRRLRSRRSDRRGAYRRTQGGGGASPRTPSTHNNPAAGNSPRRTGGTPNRQLLLNNDTSLSVEAEAKPVERAVEARSNEDVSSSIVRTLYFADTFLVSSQHHTPTLWAGTNTGSVYAFQITVPSNDKRENEQVQCILAKEIHLRHHAPVVSMCVLDRNFYPLPPSLYVQHERAKPADMSSGHSIIICSEEQLKIFSLPSLAGKDKFKLTAHEGTKIRKAGFVNFCSRNDGSYVESDLVCLTNQGDIQIYSVPHLRRQLRTDCIKKDNIIGIVSSVFTLKGEGFYLTSPSELIRFSVSAQAQTRPLCIVRPPHQSALANAVGSNRSTGANKNTSHSSHNNDDGDDSWIGNISVISDEGRFEVSEDSITSGDRTAADSIHIHISASPMSSGGDSSGTVNQRNVNSKVLTTDRIPVQETTTVTVQQSVQAIHSTTSSSQTTSYNHHVTSDTAAAGRGN